MLFNQTKFAMFDSKIVTLWWYLLTQIIPASHFYHRFKLTTENIEASQREREKPTFYAVYFSFTLRFFLNAFTQRLMVLLLFAGNLGSKVSHG